MCGFFNIVSQSREIIASVAWRKSAIERTILSRGPDHTGAYRENDICALHTLLSMTGPVCVQPIADDEHLLVFNGEIYNDYLNYTDEYGDTQYLAKRIKEDGIEIVPDLDG